MNSLRSAILAPMRILVVEDEPKMADVLRRGMARAGLAVDVCDRGGDAPGRAAATEYDAIVLDAMLPDLDGLDVCRRLRADRVWSPVLMLTARDGVPDRVPGLDAGADDYVAKPFAFEELLARLRALARRGPVGRPPVLEGGDLRLHPAPPRPGRAPAGARGRRPPARPCHAQGVARRYGARPQREGVLAPGGVHAQPGTRTEPFHAARARLGGRVRESLQRRRRPRRPAAREGRPGLRPRLAPDRPRSRLPPVRALNRLPLRLRLTLVFAGAAALLLGGIGPFIYLRVKAGLDGELDHSLRLRAAQLVPLSRMPSRLRADLDAAGQPAQLLSRDGRVLASVRVRDAKPLLGPVHLPAARHGEVRFERAERTRILARPAPGGIVAVAASMRQRERTLETLGGVLLIGLPITLLLASAAGYAVAAGALRPVERMRGHAARISEATPEARLPLPAAEDELHRLGETLNDMLARLATAAEQERAFVTNASHELRTPLAILKAEVEVALHPDSTPAELRRGLESAGEEADRLARLAEDLLLIARGEPGAPPPAREEVGLADLARQVAARFDGTALHTTI